MPKSRALISVSNKSGLAPLAEALHHANYELISSGGTSKFLQEHGFAVTPIEKITGNPESFQGRMKTLSFQVSSAILFDRDNPSHRKEAEALGILPIDVVVCNFYPFEKTHDEKLSREEAIELIDIGGPTLARAAAKNFRHVVVLVDPNDYPLLIRYLHDKKSVPPDERLKLAAKVFQKTADYDAQIETYFRNELNEKIIRLDFRDGKTLRYGENPHQHGSVYWEAHPAGFSLQNATQITGKELSFNNLLDADAAINTLFSIEETRPACVIVKHNNPCGAASAKTIEDAFLRAWESDPVAAFGGIVVLNRPLTNALVQQFLDEKKFVEMFIAPAIEKHALELLTEKKKNLIVLIHEELSELIVTAETDFKKIRGGILVQEKDMKRLRESDFEVVSKRAPTPQESQDLRFAWHIGRECKSNSIVLAKNQQVVGTGLGQQDRVRACRLAVEKAGPRASRAAAASDGFFPFPDGPEVLIEAGVSAIIHPGGSIRDADTVAVCNRHNVALVTTKGIRAFKH